MREEFTDAEKVEAIRALVNGEWDNPQLARVGPLFTDTIENIFLILAQSPKDEEV